MSDLDGMAFEALADLREEVDKKMKDILNADKEELAAKERLLGVTSKPTRSTKGSTIAAKYRNPKDPSQTWSGRGLPPRWMSESGKRKEYFLIENIQKRAKQKEDSNAGADAYAE